MKPAGTQSPGGCPPALHYVTDSAPGFSRRMLNGVAAYFDERGRCIRDKAVIERINALAIPPAYREVWICPDALGHLQATGRDARGRKQYRYHPLWREVRDAAKYERLLAFGNALSRLRRELDQRLRIRQLSRERVIAAVILLLDQTCVRVGNQEYARQNKSYGLTTLRNRHVTLRGDDISFHFRGKSGVKHEVSLRHPRLARVLRRCRELPGQHLFQYLDADGHSCSVSSSDINECLHDMAGADFTAKDYRTWAGSTLALASLRELTAQGRAPSKQAVAEVVKQVAVELGNTPAVCRKCYIHPAIMDAYLQGDLDKVRWSAGRARRRWLKPAEVDLIVFLQTCASSPPSG
ncbi:DNA topoisomerase IB [Halopseudomonas sp. SMJS2]|uniref:DNA topoisomerase IB n=1 Tax=Halopseudomonas sp. SMJS2 TaxID=3041098 RepID=UPI00245372C9|nr:DNA topoisomerase IB [Halopseudomonas sp. SMJS2]WGK60780.1 DNA topoisomerase IB [Halopseudomonas sp. SMJS2]